MPYEIGDVVAGKFHIVSVLGDGGMGVVYGAVDATGRWRAALKVLRQTYAHDKRTVARFHREAMLSAYLRSLHVVRIYDAGTTEEGLPYMAMEQLNGMDLGDLLAERGRLPSFIAVNYVMQACNAIAEAHTYGIIHRDLKPSNLFLANCDDGRRIIKVLDFGVGKVRDAPVSQALTRPGEFCGSVLYMAPEQANSAMSVDHRADIWSLGMVLYELISGVNPIEHEDVVKTFLALIKGTIPPLVERAEVPQGLSDVVQRCLDRDPEQRYTNVGTLAMDLAPFTRG